jgi:protein-L-isoaspartate(D-aspartate) O-methyltransferase
MNERGQERSAFIRDLEARGFRDEKVLEALARVPREEFVTIADMPLAFADRALPIACGQTISQPYMVAVMTEALELAPGHKVLEIGTGSGYQAAILAALVREVVTIERHRELADSARAKLQRLGFGNVTVIHADGMAGASAFAPFDRIIVTAAAASGIPAALTGQLAPGGVLVAPIGAVGEAQKLLRIRKDASGDLKSEDLMAVRFVPLLPGLGGGA